MTCMIWIDLEVAPNLGNLHLVSCSHLIPKLDINITSSFFGGVRYFFFLQVDDYVAHLSESLQQDVDCSHVLADMLDGLCGMLRMPGYVVTVPTTKRALG